MRHSALLVLLLLIQDPADKVRALVDQLESDEIAEREGAQTELIKLGTANLPLLRELRSKAEGEKKARLDAIVGRLERDERAANLLGPGPLVTLKVKDRPAAEVFRELSKLGGVPVEGQDLPADTLVSLDVKSVSPAAAVDELCRTHGKLMYSWATNRVVITPAPYRRVPAFDRGPYRLLVDGLGVTFNGTPPTTVTARFSAGIIGPPGRIPHSVTLFFERVADERGVDLLTTTPVEATPAEPFNYPMPPWASPEAFRLVEGTCPQPLGLKADRISVRGYASLKFAMGVMPRATIRELGPDSAVDGTDVTLEIRRWDRDGRRLSARVRRAEVKPVRPAKPYYVLEDAKGARREAYVMCSYPTGRARGASEHEESLEFSLPEAFEPKALVLGLPEVEEVRIPFEIEERLR